MNEKNKAFTLIEILVVVAIIAILATAILISLSGANKKARVSSVKSVASAISSAGVVCCSKEGADFNAYIPNNEICSFPVGGYWPSSDYIGDLTPGHCYAGDFEIHITMQNINKTECDGNDAVCTSAGCIFPDGC